MSSNTVAHPYGLPPSPTTAVVSDNAKQYVGAATQPTKRRLDSAAPNRMPLPTTQQRKHSTEAAARKNDNMAMTVRQTLQECSIVQPEDSLEYFIKFPTQNYMDAPDTDFVFVYKETNVPIVLLLGWAGCQDRYLMKYSKIYEDRGLITIRYTAPVDTLFWKRTAMVPIGEKILKLLYDMNFDAHPVIFHIFSNGGAYLYQHISLAMRQQKRPIQIRGMIFDSAPGERRMLGLYRAVSAIYGKERKKFHCITAIFITLTLSVMWIVEEAYTAFKSLFVKPQAAQLSNPFSGLKNEPNQFPQMFLYSKGDIVIPYQDIEKFIAMRQQMGVEVSAACFEDAEHVKIYTKYPSQYVHCICTFINSCLALPYKENSSSSCATTPTSINSGSISTKYD